MHGGTPALVLFDGVCNLCTGAVTFIIRRDPARRFTFASLQSPAAQEILNRHQLANGDLDTMILVENGKVYQRSTAALRIARKLRAPWPLCYAFIIIPRPLRDLVYRWIARHRYQWFGQRETCMIPDPTTRDRFLS